MFASGLCSTFTSIQRYFLLEERVTVRVLAAEANVVLQRFSQVLEPPLAESVPPERVRPLPTLISSTAPVDAVERPSILAVAIVRPLVVIAPS